MTTKRLLALSAVFALTLVGLDTACAQVEKTFQRTDMRGKTVETPYVTYEEFRSVALRFPGGKVPLRKLLTVSSLDEAVRLLGEPQSTERNDFSSDAPSYFIRLHYGEDISMDYDGYADGTLKLSSVELRSSKWGLEIGDKELSPGLDIASLDKAVQWSAVSGPLSKQEDKSGGGAIYIAKPGASKSGTVDPLANGLTQFNFNTDETGTIKVVRLSRIPQN